MSAIPYRMSKELSYKVFNFPSQVYRALHEVLISGDGIGLLVQFLRKHDSSRSPSDQASYFVLKHIALRTFAFSKVFEFIRIGDIADGLPTIGISRAPIKNSTIKKTLRQLTNDHYIVKVQLPRSKAVTALYGLNLPTILTVLDLWWEIEIEDRNKNLDNFDALTRSVRSRRTQNILKCLCWYFEHFEKTFKFLADQKLPVAKFAEFVNALKLCERKPGYWDSEVVGDLKDAFRVKKKDLMPEKWKEFTDDQGAQK